MSSSKRQWMPLAALMIVMAGSQLSPATARADLHNVTYRARIDGVAPGSQATFVINGGQTNTAGLSSVPGNAFEAEHRATGSAASRHADRASLALFGECAL